MQKNTRHIKKYANRRLYDTSTSKYINVDELISFITKGDQIVVLDAKTDADITTAILLQAIQELPTAMDIFPSSFLLRTIRLSQDNSSNSALAKQLSASLALLDAQLEQLEDDFPWPEPAANLPAQQETEEPVVVVEQQKEDPEMTALQSKLAQLEARLQKF